jgi:HAD superfamily hydrolase (TIGR01509 family)
MAAQDCPFVTLRAVVFDVGETLVDESRMWFEEARRAGVAPLTFFAALGALIDRGEDHRGLWRLLGVERTGPPVTIEVDDLYPDAAPCLASLRAAGLVVGVAGNQPEGACEALARLGLPVDFIASSARWGVAKPSPAFFDRVAGAAGVPAPRVAYVGDRLDNDVIPARAAGMFTVLVRRGPWGHLHAQRPGARLADARIDGLDELPGVLRAARAPGRDPGVSDA